MNQKFHPIFTRIVVTIFITAFLLQLGGCATNVPAVPYDVIQANHVSIRAIRIHHDMSIRHADLCFDSLWQPPFDVTVNTHLITRSFTPDLQNGDHLITANGIKAKDLNSENFFQLDNPTSFEIEFERNGIAMKALIPHIYACRGMFRIFVPAGKASELLKTPTMVVPTAIMQVFNVHGYTLELVRRLYMAEDEFKITTAYLLAFTDAESESVGKKRGDVPRAKVYGSAFTYGASMALLGPIIGLAIQYPMMKNILATGLASHVRELQAKADVKAMEMLRRERVAPQTIVAFWEQYSKFAQNDSDLALTNGVYHPATPERLDRIRKLAAQIEADTDTPLWVPSLANNHPSP